jgi:ABC-type multidrug transport system fused ATPase/permease subunit
MNPGAVKKVLTIMEKPFKRKALFLQIYLVIGVLFESAGLGLVIPLVAVVTDVEHSDRNFFIRAIKSITGGVSNSHLVFIMLGSFVFFYVIKTVFLSFMVWKQSEFTQGLSRNVSTRLYRGYLLQPYAFFLDKNSGVLLKNVVSEISAFTGYVQWVMYLQTELAVLVGIVATLLFLQPLGALIVFGFVGSVSYVLFSFSKKRVTVWGKERQQYDGLRTKNLSQGLSGISELKLFHKEDYFVNKYDSFNGFYYHSQRKVQFVQQVQRFYLELVLIVSIVVIALTVIFQEKSLGSILPTLAIFLFASLRLLPSANRIIANLQGMRFAKPGVDLVYDEFMGFAENKKRNAQNKLVTIHAIKESIRLQNIDFTYPSAQQKALDNINIDITAGSVIGIIGQSGSGKTTLVNIMTGLLSPGSGQILIDDTDVTDSISELQKFIGYVPQTIFLLDDTLKRNIAFGIADEEIDKAKLQQVIEAAQLEIVVNNMPDGVDTMVGERGVKLSGGQRQRIGIARALYNDPAVLILDEGTSALDTETENYIMESVALLKGKLTIILIAHRYTTLHFCDIVYKIQNGKMVSKGKLEELI